MLTEPAPIYLDYNATAPLRQEARDVMIAAMDQVGNASSVHSFGRACRKKIEDARKKISTGLGIPTHRLVFTSGATESCNTILQSFPGAVILPPIEHDAVYQARKDAHISPVLNNGTLDLDALEAILTSLPHEAILVSVMLANNETGILQPIQSLSKLIGSLNKAAQQKYIWIHCDAVQGIGKVPMPNWTELGIDFVSISSHKVGGPSGVGLMAISPEVHFTPLLKGGGQERSFRSGTENFLGILGFSAALEGALREDWAPVERLRDQFESALKTRHPEMSIIGKDVPRLKNTSTVIMPDVRSELQLMRFDLENIAVSAGAACSSGKVTSSRILKAMQIPETQADCAIRFSLGTGTTENEVKIASEIWSKIYQECRPLESAAPLEFTKKCA